MSEPSAVLHQLLSGDRLGAFEIVAFIARGGMGSVYQARNTITGELRALKVVLPQLAQDETYIARFMREIRLAASIEHPNLVRIYEPAMDRGMIFLPMELLEGETLAQRIRRSGKIDARDAVGLLLPVCDAIAVVHTRRVIHRDLKPSNIFLTKKSDGTIVPKVLDFGAARDIAATGEYTESGTVIGSAHYMPPEQASGARDLDTTVDQYALGVILYQLIAGTRPYENDASGTALGKLLRGDEYAPLPESLASPKLSAVIARAMERERDKRFRTVSEFADALTLAVDGVQREASALAAPLRWSFAPPPGSTLAPPPMQQSAAPPIEVHTLSSSVAAPPAPARGAKVAALVVFGLVLVGASAGVLLSTLRREAVVTATVRDASVTAASAALDAARAPAAVVVDAAVVIAPEVADAAVVAVAVVADAGRRSGNGGVVRCVPRPGVSCPPPRAAGSRCIPRPGVPCI